MNITSNSPSSKLAKCPQSTADDGHRPTWSKLKLAILVKIFGHLTATDIVRAAHVCKRWRTASNVPTLWTQTAVDVRASRVTKLTTDSLVKRGVRRVNVWSDENDAKTVGVAEQISQLLSAVTDIERLDLSGCKWSLTGNSFAQSIHPLRLVALKHLNLSFMRSLSAECLNAVADSCPNVDALNLAMCLNYSWGADWPTALCRFASLRHLDLSHCSAVDSASVRLLVATSSSVAPPLETLLLDFCSRLTDDALGYIAEGLPRLKHLSILFCSKLTGDAVRRLSNTSLEELHADTFVGISNAGSVLTRHIRTLEIRPGLKNSGANNEAVKVMATLSISGNCPNLVSLSIPGCKITDDGVMLIACIATLRELDISVCGGITVHSIGHLASGRLTQLEVLDLNWCTSLKDWIEPDEHYLSSLRRIDVSGTGLSDYAVLKLVLGSPDLTWLGLGKCFNITGHALEHIGAGLQRLENIDLHKELSRNITPQKHVYFAVTTGYEQLLGLPRLRRVWLTLFDQDELCRFAASQRPDVDIRSATQRTAILREID